MKTSELTGTALEWAVAKCEGYQQLRRNPHRFNPCLLMTSPDGNNVQLADLDYSTDWAQGGPIIEREGIDIQQVFCSMEGSFAMPCGWKAMRYTRGGPINPPYQIADTPLVAAMRCYVASKIGDEVDVPEELT